MGYKDPERQKEAQHNWYLKNKEKVLAKQATRRREYREHLHKIKSEPCMDCGVSYPPYVMDFDHRDPSTKLFGVGNVGQRGTEKFLAEIAKCDLVCANCHRIRTHKKRA